jgi:astacin
MSTPEQLQAPPDRTGLITGITFDIKPITYAVIDGMAVFEGDIVLGTVEEVEQLSQSIRENADAGLSQDEFIARGVGLTGQRYRWTGNCVAYTIASDLTNQNRVTSAIAHWEQETHLRFVERTSANASQFPNWVRFRSADGCWSSVGMRGSGQQEIGLGDGCSTGNTIHEIGHTVGLWHEQSREDRDDHIRILWENIESGMESQFTQHITDGDDYGPYDYGSIMHYPATAFSRNGQPTIETIPPGIPIGQRNGLSGGDVAAVRAMYPAGVASWLEPVLSVLTAE